MDKILLVLRFKGGKGSGNFGHKGRPGMVGGSGSKTAVADLSKSDFLPDEDYDRFKLYDKVAADIAKNYHPNQSGLDKLYKVERVKTKDNLVYGIVRHWAGSSGSIISDMMAEQVGRRLGIKGDTHITPPTRQYMLDNPDTEQALNDLGDAMYDNTQKWFKDRGITHVRAYRSYITDSNESSRLLTSWSTVPSGMRFGDNRSMKTAIIPVRQILSNPATGFGTLSESEIVVLGQPDWEPYEY